MFYQESESITAEFPDLRGEIQVIDRFVGENYKSQLSYTYMASKLGIAQYKLETLLNEYVASGILDYYTIYSCPIHTDNQIGNSEALGMYKCEDCQQEYSFDECEKENIYDVLRMPDSETISALPIKPKSNEPYVFISYSRQDRLLVDKLTMYLFEQDIECWRDTKDILDGASNWQTEVREAIEHCFALVLVASPNTHPDKSKYVPSEVSYGITYNRVIIPILIHGSSWAECMPELSLTNANYIDARTDYQDAVNRLVKSLKGYMRNTSTSRDS